MPCKETRLPNKREGGDLNLVSEKVGFADPHEGRGGGGAWTLYVNTYISADQEKLQNKQFQNKIKKSLENPHFIASFYSNLNLVF